MKDLKTIMFAVWAGHLLSLCRQEQVLWYKSDEVFLNECLYSEVWLQGSGHTGTQVSFSNESC